MSLLNEKDIIICKMCNRTVMKLVPLYDHDNSHKKQLCCRKCKESVKRGLPIERFIRREE